MTTVETPAAAGLLTVVVAGDGLHLFQDLPDDRLRLVAPGVADSAANVVVLAGMDRKFDRVGSTELPPALVAGIRAGRLSLILDASTEAAEHNPNRTTRLHNALEAIGASRRQCIYVTQDRSYGQQYADYCDAAGIGDRVTVLVHDCWIWHTLAGLRVTGTRQFEEGRAAFEARAAVRSRRFVSLNRTPRPSKIVFLLCLLRHQLWDERGFVSFGGFRQAGRDSGKVRPTAGQLAEKLPGFEDLIADVAPYLDQLDGLGTVVLREDSVSSERLPTPEAVQPTRLPEYGDSWFTVVTETEMRTVVTRVTEKVLKPLLNFHPFLVLGNPGSLGVIREFGFETFDGFFDESYDDESDVRRRFDAVFEQVVRMCEVPERELRRKEGAVREVLLANARHGFVTLPGAGRARYARAFVDRLLDALNRGKASR